MNVVVVDQKTSRSVGMTLPLAPPMPFSSENLWTSFAHLHFAAQERGAASFLSW